MRVRRQATSWAALVLVVIAACGGEEADDAAATQVAVTNEGSASIDATLSDGETELSFEGIAAGTTSGFQTASFDSLAQLTVTVGSATSRVDLGEGLLNVVSIGQGGEVSGVAATAPPSSGGGQDEGW